MEAIRKPGQGVFNIIRFNWHFYVIAFFVVVLFLSLATYLSGWWGSKLLVLATFLIALSTIVSLVASWWVYDLSNLYTLKWLKLPTTPKRIVNINAGFDETSKLLQQKYPNAKLLVLDFYDPALHTEVSIHRARQAYPPYPGTRSVTATSLPLAPQSLDFIFLCLSAHEIRDNEERTQFFQTLKKSLTPNGRIVLVEHLRDLPNFLAYNIGFFHFYNLNTWTTTFASAQLKMLNKEKITPFVNVFYLASN